MVATKNGFAFLSNENGFFTTDKNFQFKEHFTTKNNLISNTVYTLLEQQDTLWVGCKKGISKIVQNKVTQNFDAKDGFKGDRVINIGIQYNLLFVIISEKSIQQLFNGKIVPLANNTLQMSPNYAASSSLIKPNLSEVVIGDHKSMQILDLMEFQPDPYVIIPKIISIKINNKLVDTTNNIALPYSFDKLEFKLSPLNDLIFNRNEILYKLNDGEWQKISDTLTIAFNNLRHGNYNLYIKCINTYGIESDVRLLKTFIVKKPWWLQTWFLLLSALLIGLVVYTVVKYFAKQKIAKQLQEIKLQQQLEAERQRISRDLHDNMGAYTSALIANVQKVKRVITNDVSINQMQENAESILASLRETIWVLNNKEITVQELNDQFKNYMFKVLKNFDQLAFNTDEKITNDKKLTAATALHINKILQEIIQNIIKHSKASTINYTTIAKDSVIFIVQDNGIGFDMASKNGGNGLENMQWRAKEAGLQIDFIAELNKGTTITLTLV
jgi:signal transduction histidine kinase